MCHVVLSELITLQHNWPSQTKQDLKNEQSHSKSVTKLRDWCLRFYRLEDKLVVCKLKKTARFDLYWDSQQLNLSLKYFHIWLLNNIGQIIYLFRKASTAFGLILPLQLLI